MMKMIEMFVDVLSPTTQQICCSSNINGEIENEFFTFNAAVVILL